MSSPPPNDDPPDAPSPSSPPTETSSTDETSLTTDDAAKSLELKDLGNTALLAGRINEAITHYTSAINLQPNTPNAILLSNRAQAYIKVENYGLAITDATAAIQTDPAYPKAYYRRGTCEFALNKPKAARKDFRMVCKLKPKDKDARAKYRECDRLVKEAAFCAAIVSVETAPLSDTFDPNSIRVEGYDGPHPKGGTEAMEDKESGEEDTLFEAGNMPLSFIMATIERFKDQKLIHKRYVVRLLIHCQRYFQTLPSLLHVSIPTSTNPDSPSPNKEPHVTVCGDTHGQFYDVLNIFKINGYPHKHNPYVFNGDFVDRGSFSVEVILTFLLFKMYDPECIYLTRGNHETKNMNRIYGFEGEVKHKYDDKVFDLFLEVFCQLPLAVVIQHTVFVTHGGIPVEPTTLDSIRKIKRGCEPPESGLMSDLLWSDPQPFPGKSPSKRGVGFAFGPDITAAFLEKNNLSLLVRSHEVKDEGYLVEHNGKTITIFSAPNYCDSMGNKGAFIHFDKGMKPKFTQYDSVPHPSIGPMAYAAGMGSLF